MKVRHARLAASAVPSGIDRAIDEGRTVPVRENALAAPRLADHAARGPIGLGYASLAATHAIAEA
jgi:hypothetical protein